MPNLILMEIVNVKLASIKIMANARNVLLPVIPAHQGLIAMEIVYLIKIQGQDQIRAVPVSLDIMKIM